MRVGPRAPVIPASVRSAFAPNKGGHSRPAAAGPPTASKGGLEVLFHTHLDVGLHEAVKMPQGTLIAAATADGSVAFVDGSDGRVVARCDEVHDDPPNVMPCGAKWLAYCTDDAGVTMISISGEIMHRHTVAEPAEDGKRQRCSPIDHAMTVLDGTAYVAAAGRLLHVCKAPEGDHEHPLRLESPVRALCAAPAGEPQWAYAVACADGVRLVSRAGEPVRMLSSARIIRSLGASGPWLAAAGMDGTVEMVHLWGPRPLWAPLDGYLHPSPPWACIHCCLHR